MKDKVTSGDIRTALKLRYPSNSHALLWEVAPTTGGGTRYADAVAVGLWASHGHQIEGIEIKVSRGDFLAEMKQPEKSQAVMRYCNRWWLACPRGMVAPDELPPTWGLLEYTEEGAMRQRVKAPKLEAEPPTLGFMAALIRRSAGLDEDMSRAEVAKALAQETVHIRRSMEEKYQRAADLRVRHAEEAMQAIEKVKLDTGIDLLEYRWNGHKLGEAVALFAKLGCKYDGLSVLRQRLTDACAAIDAAGII